MFRAGRAVAKRVATPSPTARLGLAIWGTSAFQASLIPFRAPAPAPPKPCHRSFSLTSAVMSGNSASSPRPHIVAKTEADAESVRTGLEQLLAGRWSLTANGQAIERSFKFKNFTKTWDFMTSVALQCKLKNHHPEWSNVYTTTYIRWTTHHNGPGLTLKDVELAGLCDDLGRAFGELLVEEDKKAADVVTQPQHTSKENAASTLQGLANSAADVGACDCSGPEPAKKA